MAVHPSLVKRLTEKRFRKLWEKSDGGIFYARYCPVDAVSAIPCEWISYGTEVYVTEIHEGDPLMVKITTDWKSNFDVLFSDLAIAKDNSY